MRIRNLLAAIGVIALAALVMAASLPSGQKLIGEATGRALDLNAEPSALTRSDGVTPVATWDDDSFDIAGAFTATTVNGSLTSMWDTAYTDRMKWDGGATGLNAATGRTSLGLGSAATRAAEDTFTNGSNLPSGAAVAAFISSLGYITSADDTVSGSELDGVFSSVTGLLKRTGTAAYTSITDNSANWNTAYTDRLKWDGGATGLAAATGRTSLGLGSAATRSAEDTMTGGENLPDGAAIIAYYGSPIGPLKGGTGLSTIGASNQILGVNSGASGLEYKTLSASGGITITNSTGGIAIGASGVVPNHALLDGSAHTDTLAGTVALGDVIVGNATPKWSKLAGNTTTTRKFLRQTGTGSASALPAWDTVAKADVGLGNVENTALSTWTGSAALSQLGYVTTSSGSTHVTQGDLIVGSSSDPVFAYNSGDIEAVDDILARDDIGAHGDGFIKGQLHVGDISASPGFPSLCDTRRDYYDTAELLTTTAAGGTLYSFPVNTWPYEALTIEVTVTGSQASAANSATYKGVFMFKNVNGTVSLVSSGTPTVLETDSSWDWMVTTSGTNGVVMVHPASSQNVRWVGSFHVVAAQSY